jgi:hypothetical protein
MMSGITDTYRRVGLQPSVGQLSLAKSILGERLGFDEAEVYRLCVGRPDCPQTPFQEVTCIIGRKGGKSEYVGVPIIIHRALTDDDGPGVYLLIAPSKGDQARIVWAALVRQLQHGFAELVAEIRESAGEVVLHNGNIIKIASANFRYLRGPKYKVVVVDEACFFTTDDPELGGANPLEYVLDSIAGGMIATASPLLLLLSTPWVKDGVVWTHYRDRDVNLDRLVWTAPTLTMNPFANVALMERHRKDRGENFYRREYLAEFSEDAIPYIEAADIDAAIAPQLFFPIRPNVGYVMGLDPGRKRDHFGAAVAHREGDAVVVDWCTEWKPGILGLKYAAILPQIWTKAREYKVRTIASDQIDFGGLEASVPSVNGRPEFTMERVMTGGQSGAELADVTRALFAQRNLILPNQPGLGDEFKRLADYLTQGGGRDVRAKRGHDDRSRAVMLAVYMAYKVPQPIEPWLEVLNLNASPPGPIIDRRGDLSDPFNDWGFAPSQRGPSFGRPN